MALKFRRLSIEDIEGLPRAAWSVGSPFSSVGYPTVESTEDFPTPLISSPSFIRRRVATSDSLDDLAPTTLSDFPAYPSGNIISGDRRYSNKSMRTVLGRRVRSTAGPSNLVFVTPRALLCVSRKTRREVIFARGKHGGHHRKPRYRSHSYIWCV